MDKYVIDSGPLIHLDQISQLYIIRKLPRIFIPGRVLQEIRHDTSRVKLRNIEKWPNTKIISPTHEISGPINALTREFPLHQGEIDAIRISLQLRPCIFLTDDLAARRAAERTGIEVHGSVGLIVYALRRKWLSIKKAESALNLLYQRSSLFITYAIIEEAIRRLKSYG